MATDTPTLSERVNSQLTLSAACCNPWIYYPIQKEFNFLICENPCQKKFDLLSKALTSEHFSQVHKKTLRSSSSKPIVDCDIGFGMFIEF